MTVECWKQNDVQTEPLSVKVTQAPGKGESRILVRISLRYAETEKQPVQICCGAAPPTAALQHTSTLLLCDTCSDSESRTSRKFELHLLHLNDRKNQTTQKVIWDHIQLR